ncbi:sugar-binding transcriptional regulator [Marinisporobacter balticus]|uniref:DNA-binding transcriptional regulator LsrR (DeoR family) n=1 Tax=Marinisporobacter balticus TaxID=2018667 RepID=A0A4R2KUG6_9FIRM|nr:sugar-binding transcriptional regulator [Marinisporobacter balticus]TCO74769.1 DNA-binding transcriptional regulator LsrR (DeoR family) [Marinisporobacter balticus]
MYEDNLIYKVTWFYYADNMTQKEIAEHLGISRMKVVKLLNQAKSDGIIKFKMNPDAKAHINLERDLIEKFHLEDVFVVPSTPSNVNHNIAKGAAQYIEEKVEANTFINIGYGNTVSRTINHLIYSLEKPISLVTLSGGVSYYTSSIVSGTRKRTATSITPNIHILPAPLLASSEEVANIFLNEKSIKNIINMSELSSMSIVGIGSVSNDATIFKYHIVNEEDRILLEMQGAVGDILSQFYDKNGNILQSDLHKKLVSIKLDTLKASHKTIGVAGGKEKIQAIYSALIGGYLNVLITDEDTANSLINFKNE